MKLSSLIRFFIVFSLIFIAYPAMSATQLVRNKKIDKKFDPKNCTTESKNLDSYLDRVQANLKKEFGPLVREYFHKQRGVLAQQKETEIKIKVKVDELGKILSSKVTRSSGEEALDRLILSLIQKKSQFPPPKKLCNDILDEGILISFMVNNTTFR